MAIAHDADSTSITTGFNSSGLNKTWSHTCTGANLVLVLCVDIWQDVAGTGTVQASPTYNGVAMTKADSVASVSMASEIWYLKNPPTGAHTVSVTISGDTDAVKMSATSFTGVDQTTPLDNHGTATGTSGNPTESLTTVADNCAVIATLSRFSTTNATTSQTSIYNDHVTSVLGASSYQLAGTAGSKTDTYTGTAAQDWSMVMASFKPASSGLTISVSDSSTATESVSLTKIFNLSVSDSTTVTESVSTTQVYNLSVSDSSTATETVTMLTAKIFVIQSKSANTAAASVAATFNNAPVQNNLLVATVYSGNTTAGVAITGWTLVDGIDDNIGHSMTMFYKVAGAGESSTVTATSAGSGSMQLDILEIVGNDPTNPLDQHATSTTSGVAANSLLTGTVTTTNPNEVIIAALGIAGSGTVPTYTNGFIGNEAQVRNFTGNLVVTSTGSYSTTIGFTGTAVRLNSVIASFRTLGTDLFISTSDSSTAAESVTVRVASFINVSDTSTGADIVSMTLVSLISVSDSTTATESVNLAFASLISVSDSSTATESVTVSNANLGPISVSDSSTATESVTMLMTSFINKSDSSTAVDAPSLVLVNIISVSDSTTATESVNVTQVYNLSVTDSTTGTESVTVRNATLGPISVSDSTTATESVTMLELSFISVSDSSTATEVVTMANATLGSISVSDSSTATESVNMTRVSLISVSDSSTATEAVSLTQIYTLSVSDSTTGAESVSMTNIYTLHITDSTTATESTTVTNSQLGTISVSDSTTATESVTISESGGFFNISVSDSTTATESTTVRNTQLGPISVSDSSTIVESRTLSASLGNINVHDSSAITESITTFVTAHQSGIALMRSLENTWALGMDELEDY